MRIKVSDHLMYAVTTNYIRQWCEALITLPGVVYIPEQSSEWADVGIDIVENVGVSVFIELSDPHSLVNLIPVDSLLKRWHNILPGTYKNPSEVFCHHAGASITVPYYDKFSIVAFTVWDAIKEIKIKPEKYHLPHSLPQNLYPGILNQDRDIGILLTGNPDRNWYPLRRLMWDVISTSDLPFYSSAGAGWVVHKKTIEGKEKKEQIQDYDKQVQQYVSLLHRSKIMVFDGGVFDYPVKKYLEAMACGCLVLAPMPLDADLMGFVDGVNMVVVDETNFMEKCRYYLEHEEERKQITDAAYNLYQERHTCTKSAERFLAYLKTR